uniref:Dilute domain-containing protein n=1 Tax=Sinocyclocheilus rhinocerous TaxID=307959 RepID=A0A673I903_9TELE
CFEWSDQHQHQHQERCVLLGSCVCVCVFGQMLYPLLPGVLDSHAFSDSGQLQVSSQVRRVLDVCSQSLRLLRAFDVHPDISAQLFSYLFFFINALLFNLLMERGSGGAFYCWSRGVQVRANLDLLMDWAHGAGLADLAHTYLLKLSSAVNLLATPKENLLQVLLLQQELVWSSEIINRKYYSLKDKASRTQRLSHGHR